jgi:inhibitor of KinA
MNTTYSITPLGDSALIIEWEQEITLPVHAQVMQAFHYLQSLQLPYVTDLIPAYASLSVLYNAVQIREEAKRPAFIWLKDLLTNALQQTTTVTTSPPRQLQIPVCYHPSLGIDITEMAKQKNITTNDIITLHSAGTYTVYMLGFLPGFPYMGKVHTTLATPRLKQPRLQVAAGSVGIAGEQTGIYPLVSPGGWNIIGQTPIRLFDAALDDPCYCRPGDQVQFVPISLEEFHQLSTKNKGIKSEII